MSGAHGAGMLESKAIRIRERSELEGKILAALDEPKDAPEICECIRWARTRSRALQGVLLKMHEQGKLRRWKGPNDDTARRGRWMYERPEAA